MFQPPEGYARGARRRQSEIRASEERRSYGFDRGDAFRVAWGWLENYLGR